MPEININYLSADHLYCQIYNQSGLVYNFHTNAFETESTTDWSNYYLSLIDNGNNTYSQSFPTSITTPGNYTVLIYSGNDTYTDILIGANSITWSGSQTPQDVGYAWITLSQYKSMFNITTSAQDTQISTLLPMVSVACDNFLSYSPIARQYIKTYIATGTDILRLGVKNVSYIVQVVMDYTGQTPTTISGSNFIVDGTGSMRFVTGSNQGRYFYGEFIQVQFIAGYDPLPPDLQLACGLVVQTALLLMDQNTLVKSQKIKDAETAWDSVFLKMLDLDNPIFATSKGLLQKYKSYFVY